MGRGAGRAQAGLRCFYLTVRIEKYPVNYTHMSFLDDYNKRSFENLMNSPTRSPFAKSMGEWCADQQYPTDQKPVHTYSSYPTGGSYTPATSSRFEFSRKFFAVLSLLLLVPWLLCGAIITVCMNWSRWVDSPQNILAGVLLPTIGVLLPIYLILLVFRWARHAMVIAAPVKPIRPSNSYLRGAIASVGYSTLFVLITYYCYGAIYWRGYRASITISALTISFVTTSGLIGRMSRRKDEPWTWTKTLSWGFVCWVTTISVAALAIIRSFE